MTKTALMFLIVITATYCREMDKRKVPQVTLVAVSGTAIITGWSLYFMGDHLAHKNANLYDKSIDVTSVNKYYNEMKKNQKLSKSGLLIQGFGGLFLGVSFFWRYFINKAEQNQSTFQRNTTLIPYTSIENTGLLLCYSF